MSRRVYMVTRYDFHSGELINQECLCIFKTQKAARDYIREMTNAYLEAGYIARGIAEDVVNLEALDPERYSDVAIFIEFANYVDK